jgi:hypothetical protein
MTTQINISEIYGTFNNKVQVFNDIVGDSFTRNSHFNVNGVYCYMMEVADQTGNFVSDIIEKAVRGQAISEKQAWCVAYFAEKNGFTA